jgi:hypothetical protein
MEQIKTCARCAHYRLEGWTTHGQCSRSRQKVRSRDTCKKWIEFATVMKKKGGNNDRKRG